jgi:hypothetical protein
MEGGKMQAIKQSFASLLLMSSLREHRHPQEP